MPAGGFDFVLLGQRAMDALLNSRERNLFLQGQILWAGFRLKVIPYRRARRKVGASRWTFGRKLTYLLDGVVSYSFLPIRLISLVGLIVAVLGFSYAGIILVLKLVGGIPIEGWAPLMITMLALAGVQMLMLGVIGEYVWRGLLQTLGRDAYVVDAVYDELDGSGA